MRASFGTVTILMFVRLSYSAPVLTRILPPVGQPGDVVTITGSGFGTNPATLNVRFGPNRAPALTASPTQITVQVPNGQPLGPTQVTVSSGSASSGNASNALTYITASSDKIPLVRNNPLVCGTCSCSCGCGDPLLTSCPNDSLNLGSGGVYGDSGEFDQTATDLAIPGRPGASSAVQYRLTRVYRSSSNSQGPLGSKWVHNYFEQLVIEGDGPWAVLSTTPTMHRATCKQ